MLIAINIASISAEVTVDSSVNINLLQFETGTETGTETTETDEMGTVETRTEAGVDTVDTETKTGTAVQVNDGVVGKPDRSIERFRTPFEVLTERAIGLASKPVKFDWRRSYIHFGSLISQLAELNNFDSIRAGGLLRIPVSGLVTELSLSYIWVWDSVSSRMLEYTPYRQPGRPERFELDFAVAYPIAEGVVTSWPRYFPATEMVLSVVGDFRYLIYPAGFKNHNYKSVAKAILQPTLTEKEVNNLDAIRQNSMKVDRARYGLMLGASMDIYFQTGLFVTPRFLLAAPIMAVMSETSLHYWWDISLIVGWAF